MRTLIVEPLTEAAYHPYGDVLGPQAHHKTRPANLGTATRYLDIARLHDLRAPAARPHLSLYRCEPAPLPLRLRLLERHAHSSQLFTPVGEQAHYLAVVALGADAPDLTTLRAFDVRGTTGITYLPGVWHHPLIVLDQPGDFLCLVWEDGTDGDCEEWPLPTEIAVQLGG
jgi:ureidoglycolate lyase